VVPLEARLTDFLNSSEAFAVRDTSLYALDDGHAVEAGDQELAVAELWAVEPTDTGITPWHADLRVSTRAVRIEIDMHPYLITGTLHRAASRSRLAKPKRRRRRLIPLTDAVVTFSYMGHEITRQSPVVIFNRERVGRIRRVGPQATRSASAGGDIHVPS
jgi:hypothetical protein